MGVKKPSSKTVKVHESVKDSEVPKPVAKPSKKVVEGHAKSPEPVPVEVVAPKAVTPKPKRQRKPLTPEQKENALKNLVLARAKKAELKQQ